MMKDLTYWLRKTPQPVAVLADDKRIEVPRNGRAWRDLTQTIKALEPTKLTCLAGDGTVIRSIVLEHESDDDGAATASPEMTDVQLFAKLLAEAYDKASSKMQPIVDSAMAFVERGGTRLAKAEAENDRLRAHIHKLNLQIGELTQAPVAAPTDEGGILGSLVAGAMQGLAASNTTPPTPITAAQKGTKK